MTDSKILIVEDECIVATDLKQRLENMGHEIVGIEVDGESAIETALETEPDIIIMDITLKGDIDGIETAQKIHNKNDIPIIYLSGSSDKKTVKRAEKTKPNGYILKPFAEKKIRNAIEIKPKESKKNTYKTKA
jgi:DNA-binding NarL/FixJ family response regulator